MYQFENNEDFICTFMQTLFNILDKKNSIVPVHSPPSAGKNCIFAAVVTFVLIKECWNCQQNE